MLNKWSFVLWLLCLFIITGMLGHPAWGQKLEDVTFTSEHQLIPAYSEYPCGATNEHLAEEKVETKVPLVAPPDKALLVFINEWRKVPIQTKWAIDGRWVGASEWGSYMVALVSPGRHRMCIKYGADSLRPKFTSITVEAGKRYVFFYTSYSAMDEPRLEFFGTMDGSPDPEMEDRYLATVKLAITKSKGLKK